ncbi:MAG: hypothetical protein UR14_C0010G0012 [candidate division TM6 bacterium GW2011_GWE2_31_21]|nr:MAG: hypothetical protein UR14_C0010G0012 [candidate division TM6 bacterium GW2011_GWE2_31_21]
MQTPSRDKIKRIFRKRKHLKIPKEFDSIDFSNLNYYSWYDPNDHGIYMLFEYNNVLDGIAWDTTFFSQGDTRLGRCEICKKVVELRDIVLITAKTRFKRKGVIYIARGNYVCVHYKECNKEMKNGEGLEKLIQSILEDN